MHNKATDPGPKPGEFVRKNLRFRISGCGRFWRKAEKAKPPFGG
jgi:hypothetical protein